MNIFALWGEIEVNRKQAETDIKAVEKQAEKSGKKMESSFNKVTTVVGTVIKEVGRFGKKVVTVGKEVTKQAGIPLAAMTALAGGLAKTTADYGDAVAKSAQEVGMGVVAYQELGYALGQNNLNAEETLRVFGRLNQRIGLARNGNENYRKSLEKMGISMEELDKGAIVTEETFVQILESLSQMPDSQMQAAYASDIFGTMLSRKMMPLIRSGAEGIEELRSRAHELGIVMDEEAARKSELFGDTMSDLAETSKGFGRSIGQELLAPFVNVATWMTDIIAKGTEWVRENPKLVRQIIIWGGAIAGVLGVLVTLGTVLVVTGKIIGALGAIFNILTSKPLLIIAAIAALYLAWESDWLGIRTAVENAWEVIGPVIDAIIEWGGKTLSTVWNWTTGTTSKFLTWVSETAWPWIGNAVGTAWNWTTKTTSKFLTWVQETAWPWIGKTVITGWDWTTGKVSEFITWVKDVAAPWFGKTVSTAWNWTLDVGGDWFGAIKKGFDTGDWSDFWSITSDIWSTGVVLAITLSSAVQGISAVISAIQSGLGLVASTGASLGIPGLVGALSIGIQLMEAQTEGSYANFGKNVLVAGLVGALAYPVFGPAGALTGFNLLLNLKIGEGAYDGFVVLFEWIGHNLEKLFSGQWGQFMSLDDFIQQRAQEKVIDISVTEYGENLQHAIDWLKTYPEEIWDEYAEMAARIWDVTESEIREALGLDAIREAIDGVSQLDDLLDAIYRAEGGAGASVPYGMTSFKGRPVSYYSPADQARWEELSQGLEEGSEPYWRAAAQTTVESYWGHFQKKFPEVADKSFGEVGPEMQQMFVAYLGAWFSPPSASDLNINWVPNVLSFMDFDELSKGFRNGFGNVLDTMEQTVYDKAKDHETAADFLAKIYADRLIGQSPPPLGPLSNIDEGGANVMEAWVEGAGKGLKAGMPALASGLEKVKGLFKSVWDKVPEEIKEPIESAMGYIGGLIEQAEEALWKLDDFQDELDALLGGGKDPEGEAQGFMARLAAGLNEKLDQLDEPMNRFTEAVFSAGRTLFEFGKALASGNWLDAFLTILMETESFAKAMELIGAVLAPVVALFDLVLAPIINGLLKLWNAIIDGLASISIFGWKPFAGLKDKRIPLVGEDSGAGGGGEGSKGSGGRQVSEITGPTRDLLTDLLAPIANFGQIVAPIQEIRDILDARLPYFNDGVQLAGAGAGIGGNIIFEPGAIVVNSTAKDGTGLAREMLDEIEKHLAKRYTSALRGRGGR